MKNREYCVSFYELILHTGCVRARSEDDARLRARQRWKDEGADFCKSEHITLSERMRVWEV